VNKQPSHSTLLLFHTFFVYSSGDDSGSFYPCADLTAGLHTITITLYANEFQQGTPLSEVEIQFRIKSDGAPTPPTPPAPAPVNQPPASSSCGIPEFDGGWENSVGYPFPTAESQGAMIGNDFIVISGFHASGGGYGAATAQNYALDTSNSNAKWRRMDDLPVKEGITHGAFVVIGKKFYMCGGYLGGHPGYEKLVAVFAR